MIVGVPAEIKSAEYRVGLTPESVHELIAHGHKAVVEQNAGAGIGASDNVYRKLGAKIVPAASDVMEQADMIVKVKEPQPSEVSMLRKDQILFTYLHLAADRKLTESLMKTGATCIAYETVTAPSGALPLLAPMSRVAGRLAPQAAAQSLQSNNGGCGKLLSGGGGAPPARVMVVGAGVVGLNAATIAAGMGADVTVFDTNLTALERVQQQLGFSVKAIRSNRSSIAQAIAEADAVIGCVLVPGASAPKIVSRKMLKTMRPGSVLVDVAIDQGGCFATSRPTTHAEPTYIIDSIVHYCVANMPGAVPHTATYALNNATLPYVLTLADSSWQDALRHDEHLRNGLAIADGLLACSQTAKSLKIKATEARNILH